MNTPLLSPDAIRTRPEHLQCAKTSFLMKNKPLVTGFIGFAATVLIVTSSLGLSACSPVFNWREHRFDEHNALALLPCKPDLAKRNVPLISGAPDLSLHMAGCLAGGATFTVSVMGLPAGTSDVDGDLALARWEAASKTAFKAQSGLTAAAHVRGATVARMVMSKAAASANGSPVMSRAIYARKGLVLMQAQVLGEPDGASDGPSVLSAQSVETFLGGLAL